MKKAACCLSMVVLLVGFSLAFAQTQTSLPREVKIGTSRLGGAYHTFAAAIADVITKNTPIRAKVTSSGGPTTWLPMIENGEIDLGVINVFEAEQAYYGKMMYKEQSKGKGYNILILSLGSPSTLGVCVPAKSNIRKISDLKGKKFPRFKGNFTFEATYAAFLANGGLTYNDVIEVPRASLYDTVVEDITEGKIEAAGLPLDSAKLIELNTAVGIRFISFDSSPGAMKRTKEYFPFYIERVAKGTGINEPTDLFSYNTTLSARGDLSDDVAYVIVKTIWQNYEKLGTIHELLKTWTPQIMVSTTATIPYHPGAIRWYREQRVWTDEMEKQQKLLTKK